MVQKMIQLIHRQPTLMTARQRPAVRIGRVEPLAKTTKQSRHRKIGLAVTVVHGRIKNHRVAADAAVVA